MLLSIDIPVLYNCYKQNVYLQLTFFLYNNTPGFLACFPLMNLFYIRDMSNRRPVLARTNSTGPENREAYRCIIDLGRIPVKSDNSSKEHCNAC